MHNLNESISFNHLLIIVSTQNYEYMDTNATKLELTSIDHLVLRLSSFCNHLQQPLVLTHQERGLANENNVQCN